MAHPCISYFYPFSPTYAYSEGLRREINKVIYVSATPGDYELEKADNNVVEQIIRPTGLLDPIIEVRSSKNVS